MKYLLQILIMSLLIIPILIIDGARGLWNFNFKKFNESRRMYANACKYNYCKAFGIKYKRPSRF